MKRPATVAIIAGSAVVLLIGGGVAWWLTRTPSVEDAANAYLSALASGDVAAIDALLPDTVAGDEGSVVEDAFASATSYLTDPRIEEILDGSGGTSVRASASFSGDRRDLGFIMSESSGRWTLNGDFLGTVRVDTTMNGLDLPAGDSVRIGDALAPAGVPVGLLPAVYTVSAAPLGVLEGSETIAVSNDQPVELTVDATIAPAATTLAQEQLDAYAQACATPASTVPDSCGIRVPWAADLTALEAIAFRIERLPTVVISDDGRSFSATGGAIVATATGTSRNGSQGSFTYRSDEWSLRGGVRFEGDEMVLTVG